MSIKSNKALVLRACEATDKGDGETLLDCLHDEVTWLVPYRKDRFKHGGTMDKAGVRELIEWFFPQFSEFSFEVTNIIAEGDHVAVQARARGVGPGSAVYSNHYHFAYEIKDGKIYYIKEYVDPFELLAYQDQVSEISEG